MATPKKRPTWKTFFLRAFGPILLIAVIVIAVESTEVRNFGELVRHMRPMWFLVAFLLQAGTYLCQAILWKLALRRVRHIVPLAKLFSFSVAQQSINQTIPSGGVSGSASVAGFLTNEDIPAGAAALAVGANHFAHQASFAACLIVAIIVLGGTGHFTGAVRYVAPVILLITLALFSVTAYLWSRAAKGHVLKLFHRFTTLEPYLKEIQEFGPYAPMEFPILIPAFLLTVGIFVLDAFTLMTVLAALHLSFGFWPALAVVTIATGANLAFFAPSGLGVFEGGMTLLLELYGIPVAPALASTILYRGFTYWLPMLPGYIITHREVHKLVS